jgi:PAS domain S-box-containing protein
VTQDEAAIAKSLFTGGGEMGALMRSHDWSKTPFGSVEQWPQSLRSALSICLNSRFPIAIYWGADCLLLYNDAWRPIVGDKHPWSLGRPGREVWPEIWSDIGPEFEKVFTTGEGIFHSDELLAMYRFGYTEECFFDYTFNPIQGDSGGIDGIFNVVSETTYRVLSDRRARLLREVASKNGTARTVEEACRLIVEILRSDAADIPFSLLYLIDQDGKFARLCNEPEFALDDPIAPATVDLNAVDDLDHWFIAQSVRTAQPQVISDLTTRFGAIPGSPWTELPQEAIVLPIAVPGQTKISGVLVAVASPRRRLDDQYLDFFNQLAAQIATTIANADAYETERKRAEALAELDRAKTVFFSNVSHEFRTPLTLMLNPLEDILSNPSGPLPSDRNQLEVAYRNSQRLLKLVNTLLDFSRIEAGRIEAVYEPTNLAALTAELAGVFRSAIESAGLRLRVDCPPLPEPSYVDREMWEKIVLNLLSNAFKFTFEGEIAVVLRFCDNQVELDIQDTGTGIPASELPRIFERFHRVQGAQGRTYEGSGIGLSLVQELVHLHGGSIRVSSVIDQGTCFTVSIPTGYTHLPGNRLRLSETQSISATRTSATRILTSTAMGISPHVEEALGWLPEKSEELEGLESSYYAAPLSPSNPLTAFPSTPRILLVDDNADMRNYVKRLLSQQYDVETVSNGVAALTAIRHHSPDLVLTDVMMPELDGFGLLRELRANPQTQELPVILLSARAGEESRVEGLEAGADDYLVKPFSARELLARVEATLKLSQVRQEATRQEQIQRQEVEAAKERLETVLSSINDQFLVLDQEWRYIYVNDRVVETVGMSREALLGRSIWEVFPEIVGSEFETQVKQAIAAQTATHFEYYYPTWNHWFENHVYPSAEGVSIFVTDISDRKQVEDILRQSEDRLRMAIESARLGTWDWNLNTNQLDWDTGCKAMFGLPPEAESNLEVFFKGLHPDDRERLEQVVQWSLDPASNGIYDVEYRTIGIQDGVERWVRAKGQTYFDFAGQPQRFIGTVLDITEQKHIEIEREQLLAREQVAREQAEAANRIKDEFLTVVSHELRSPLNPILGWAKLLRSRQLDEQKTQHALEVIERNTQMQAQLINDLLDVSRILQGKLSLNITQVNLASTIEAALETVRLAAETKSIQIRTLFDPEVGCISGDSDRLQQVVWNLLSNAVKFTSQGGQVEIKLEHYSPSHAQITITDTGKGINPNFLPHVFDRFRQEDAATTRQFGGLGLGLALVRYLVEMHGGIVEANSLGEGQGATFRVRLPLLPSQLTTAQETEPSKPSLDLNGIQVLVVDDDSSTREFVAFLLELHQANVIAASTAEEAIATLIQFRPDILLSDIGMPEVDGYMLMQQVRALPPEQGGETPAIALTAYAGEINYQRAISAGFQKHISKPVEPDILIEAIASLVKRKESEFSG